MIEVPQEHIPVKEVHRLFTLLLWMHFPAGLGFTGNWAELEPKGLGLPVVTPMDWKPSPYSYLRPTRMERR